MFVIKKPEDSGFFIVYITDPEYSMGLDKKRLKTTLVIPASG